ncbi:DUF2829 domain-containing protein [Phocaeicola dorei]|jgi:hypothetical protein|uniref:DUF2829 domain-containing protein n=1 Tax=Phocaeicola dorei TaxID=357276 RepID=UPI001BDF183C|nr:DUF2829 domain-containing protein [Phocaeicola dorei]MBT1285926.1 DUF2829 domain-containing protein [Phocaeicola dorei]MBT1289794.1 DUF2829 domain-containing protein [Phocaeicola dorei]
MKKYIGTKQVEAEPMTVSEFYQLTHQSQYGDMVEDGKGDLNGYRVVYEDGFEGWMQEDEFKKSYKVVDTFLDRLHVEMRDLYEKMDKLAPFVESGKIDEVVTDKYQNYLLRLQHRIMSRYINVLECRIGRVDGSPEAPLHQMTFGDAIEVLKQGGAVRRSGWNGKGLWVIKQVPARITEDVIPKMQSLPQSAKDLILKGKGFIDYTCQCLIYNENTGRADSWVPSISDVFAEDWEIVL